MADLLVRELFSDVRCETRIWLAERVAKAIGNDARLLKKLKQYAENGFLLYEGKDFPLRLEKPGVYRIGHRNDLFRIIGFYAGSSRSEFIAADAFKKRGQSLSKSQRERIDRVARIKRDGTWRGRIGR